MTTESSKNGAMTLPRINFSGAVMGNCKN